MYAFHAVFELCGLEAKAGPSLFEALANLGKALVDAERRHEELKWFFRHSRMLGMVAGRVRRTLSIDPDDVRRGTVSDDVPVTEQDRARQNPGNTSRLWRREHDDARALHQVVHPLAARSR